MRDVQLLACKTLGIRRGYGKVTGESKLLEREH